eukprot:TRINITY_DN39892_c0_g1_i1.p1 TRINITY_DN39892_c0_g1~~TRINITY_DN39892_c0_g1_i1.p1  ORF type:complete len:215 (+),score=31.40 TRINITY_DN39892_c0_g1_i1:62-646(+)
MRRRRRADCAAAGLDEPGCAYSYPGMPQAARNCGREPDNDARSAIRTILRDSRDARRKRRVKRGSPRHRNAATSPRGVRPAAKAPTADQRFSPRLGRDAQGSFDRDLKTESERQDGLYSQEVDVLLSRAVREVEQRGRVSAPAADVHGDAHGGALQPSAFAEGASPSAVAELDALLASAVARCCDEAGDATSRP